MTIENTKINDNNPKLLDLYLGNLNSNEGMSLKTITGYENDLRMLFKYLVRASNSKYQNTNIKDIPIYNIKEQFIKNIKITDLHGFTNYLANDRKRIDDEKNNSTKTRARKIASIKGFFNYLEELQIIKENPARKLKIPKITSSLPIYMTLEECKKLLLYIRDSNRCYTERNFAVVITFLNTGLRISELSDLNIDSIRDNKITVIGKGNKPRTIDLNDVCINAINKYLEVRQNEFIITDDKGEALFLNERKKRFEPQGIRDMLKNYTDELGLKKITPHKLRHTFSTLLYQHGKVDIRQLQELLGHASISTTEIYTHTSSEQLKTAVNLNPLANEDWM